MPTVMPSMVGFAKAPWNKGRLIGQKRPLKPKEVWAIRVRLQLEHNRRDLALFRRSIASCAAATLYDSGSPTYAWESIFATVLLSFSRKPTVLSNSR